MKARTLIGMLVAGEELRDIMDAQTEAMALMLNMRNQDMLQAARHNRDMISQFLIALDAPETHEDLRETLHEALRDLSDELARAEEHVVR